MSQKLSGDQQWKRFNMSVLHIYPSLNTHAHALVHININKYTHIPHFPIKNTQTNHGFPLCGNEVVKDETSDKSWYLNAVD